ncbi:MAG: response regulator [Bdellovibrionales bacterium]|nr:response regulator [Bdellovibrionales bacterium]
MDSVHDKQSQKPASRHLQEPVKSGVSGSDEVTLDQLLSSFRPYREFVEQVSLGLERLLRIHEDLIRGHETARPALPDLSEKRMDRKNSIKPTPKRILLLDDSELSRVLVSHYFKGLPVSIDYVKTKSEADLFLEQGTYDLLLIDLELRIEPEWISWIKGHAGHTRIVALSPNVHSSEDEARASGLGYDSYVSRAESRVTLRDRLSANLWAE